MSSNSPKPRIFVGSSAEGLSIVDALVSGLDHDFQVVPWDSFFKPGLNQTLQQLVAGHRTFDFAALVFTADDPIVYRSDASARAPRDNVVFELGLFLSSLGPERTFVIHERGAELKMPSDLGGIDPLTFARHADGNLRASVRGVCSKIKEAAAQMGSVREVLEEQANEGSSIPYHSQEFLSAAQEILDDILMKLGNLQSNMDESTLDSQAERVKELASRLGNERFVPKVHTGAGNVLPTWDRFDVVMTNASVLRDTVALTIADVSRLPF